MRRFLTPLVLGLVAAIALPTGVASAASVRVTDPAGDVRSWTPGSDGTPPAEADAPGARPDITSLTLTHAKRSVVVRLTTTGIPGPRGDQFVVAGFRFEGSNKQRRALTVVATADRPGGRVNELVRESNDKRVCRKAVTSRFDYATRTIVATVPRRCLGAPKQVRVAGVTLTTTSADDSPVYFDDAMKRGGSLNSLGTTYTRFVKRG